MTSSTITINVQLDQDKVPELITWTASDLAGEAPNDAKAMLLAFFDSESRDTLKIDLWTKEMQVMEMDRFFYQALRSLADTYKRATNNAQLASSMQQFAQYFGEQVEVLKKE